MRLGEVRVAGCGGCAGKVDGKLLLVDVVEAPGDIGDIEVDIGDGVYDCSIGEWY